MPTLLATLVMLLACSPDRPPPIGPAGKSTALVDAPTEPTNLRVDTLTDTSARVVWDAVADATDYDINYKRQGGRWTNWPHRGATRAYAVIYPLEPDTEYRWAARAQNQDGVSRWVLADIFTTLADANAAPSEPYIHEEYNSIYYIDWESFRRSNLYGSNNEELIAFSDLTNRMIEFELDAAASKVYWIEAGSDLRFMRADLDGLNQEIILQEASTLGWVWGLALDTQRQVIYWCQLSGHGGGLYRASFSQSHPEGGEIQEIIPLVDTSGSSPYGLTIDAETGHLYWFSNHANNARGGGRIGYSYIHSFDPADSTFSSVIEEYGGIKPSGLIQQENWGLSQISGISIDTMADKIYWSVARLPYNSSGTLHWTHSIRKADLDGSNVETLLAFTERDEPNRLPMYHMAIDALTGSMYFTQRFGSVASGTFCVADVEDLDNISELFYTYHAELPYVGSGYVEDFQLAHTPDF